MAREDSWNCHFHSVLLEKEGLLHLSTKTPGQRCYVELNSTLLSQTSTKAVGQYGCVLVNSGDPGPCWDLQRMNQTCLGRGFPCCRDTCPPSGMTMAVASTDGASSVPTASPKSSHGCSQQPREVMPSPVHC